MQITTKKLFTRSCALSAMVIFATLIGNLNDSLAGVIYSTDFTTGYAEGATINGVDGWSSQAGVESFNVGSNGEVRLANFLRGYNAPTAFNVGDVITLTASVKSIGGNNPGFDANILQLGLTSSTNLGSLDAEAGVMLGGNGGVFRLGNLKPLTPKVDSIAIDTSFHTLMTTITKTATADQFTVVSSFAGGPDLTSTITNAALYNATTVNTVLFSQGQTNVGGIAIDSLSVDSSAVSVPEPGSLGFLALAGAAGFLRRRRN